MGFLADLRQPAGAVARRRGHVAAVGAVPAGRAGAGVCDCADAAVQGGGGAGGGPGLRGILPQRAGADPADLVLLRLSDPDRRADEPVHGRLPWHHPEHRCLFGRDLPRWHPVAGKGPVGRRHGHRHAPRADPAPHHPAAGVPAHAARIHQPRGRGGQGHLAGLGDLGAGTDVSGAPAVFDLLSPAGDSDGGGFHLSSRHLSAQPGLHADGAADGAQPVWATR